MTTVISIFFYTILSLRVKIYLRNSICSLSIFRFLKDGNSNVTLRLFCSICWLRISSVHLKKISLHHSYIMVDSYIYSIPWRMLLLRLQKYTCNYTKIYFNAYNNVIRYRLYWYSLNFTYIEDYIEDEDIKIDS